jgi:hypothetical protein
VAYIGLRLADEASSQILQEGLEILAISGCYTMFFLLLESNVQHAMSTICHPTFAFVAIVVAVATLDHASVIAAYRMYLTALPHAQSAQKRAAVILYQICCHQFAVAVRLAIGVLV